MTNLAQTFTTLREVTRQHKQELEQYVSSQRADIESWKNHPVTQAFMKFYDDRLAILEKKINNVEFTSVAVAKALKEARDFAAIWYEFIIKEKRQLMTKLRQLEALEQELTQPKGGFNGSRFNIR